MNGRAMLDLRPIVGRSSTMQSLSEQSDINQEHLLLQDAATRKDATFLPRILLALDDDSEHIDLMKDLIGLAESFDAHCYLSAVLDANSTLANRAPDWLDVITYRIMNSRPDLQLYGELLNQHHDRSSIATYLRGFLERNPEKRQQAAMMIASIPNHLR